MTRDDHPEVPGVVLVDLARREGGAERRVLQLAELLPPAGVPVHVACVAASPLHRSLVRAQVPHTPVARSRFDPRVAFRLRKLLRQHPGWVVDAHNAQSQLWSHLSRERRGRRMVATVHSEYDLSEARRGGLSLHERVLRLVIGAGWDVIAISTSVEDYLVRLGVPRDGVRTVWSAVPPGSDMLMARADVRTQLGVPQDAFVVLSAGRLVPVKNLPLLLRAVERLRREVPSAHLLLAGDGPERPRLQRLAAELGLDGNVRFLGHRTDVPALMRGSDVCAMASTIEGLPYTLIEAATAGTPIVSTDVGAIGAVFTDGESALLLDRPREEDLARALASLARDPSAATELARRARDVVMTKLSPDAMVDGTLAAYAGADRTGSQRLRERTAGAVSVAHDGNEEAT